MKNVIAFFDFDVFSSCKELSFLNHPISKGRTALYLGMALLSPLLVLLK